MCTIAVATLAVTAIATAASTYGQVQQGKAMEGQAAYQAGVARNNQIVADRMAQDALDRGAIEEQRQRLATKQLIGRQRAATAGNGVQVDSGSALALNQDAAMFGELDALTIRSNAEREALGFRTQGVGFASEAELLRLQGRNALASSKFGAASTLLSGASTVASKWYDLKKQGAL